MEFVVPIPRGHYSATVEWSRVENGTASLQLALENKDGLHSARVKFAINHPDPEEEQRERRAIHTLANVLGVETLKDTEQLHGKQCRMTVWNQANKRVSFRPAP